MLWNELEYKDQMKIIDKIVSLLEKEDDSDTQDGLMAAIHELELWSNSPCQVLDENAVVVAPAKDVIEESGIDYDSSN